MSPIASHQSRFHSTMDGFLQLLLTSAFLAGLLGGAHCAAMCGGIVGAVCRGGERGVPWARALAYNAGRVTSYAAAGAIVGGLGEAGLALRGGAPLQQSLMFMAGVALLMLALYLLGCSPLVRSIEGAGAKLWRHLQPHTRHFLPADTMPRALGLGLLWGWLPCGMVYAVLLTAAATGGAVRGAAVMAAFGAGTLPNLIAVAVFAQRLQRLAQVRILRIASATVIGAFGLYGIAHVVQPHAAHAAACLTSPGLPALLGWR